MSRNGGNRGKIITFVVVVALIAGGLAYTKGFWPFERAQADSAANAPSASHVVGAKGGTFAFQDGLTIVVPPNAVTKDATLSATAPTALSAKKGPLAGVRSNGVEFDVSLTGDDKQHVQPRKPLKATLPLTGSFASPPGVKGARALPYTAVGTSDYLWLPNVQQGNKLVFEMPHLSPKYVAWVTDQQLLDSVTPDKAKTDPDNCQQELTVSGQKVRIGKNSKGWSLKSDSPCSLACTRVRRAMSGWVSLTRATPSCR